MPAGNPAPAPRPIIVCFRDYKDVGLILGQAYLLKGTTYGINRDYPNEIVQARSSLWNNYKSCKQKIQKKGKGSVFIGFPAKLIVNKRFVRDEFPDLSQMPRTSRTQENNGKVQPQINGHKQQKLNDISESDSDSNNLENSFNIESDYHESDVDKRNYACVRIQQGNVTS